MQKNGRKGEGTGRRLEMERRKLKAGKEGRKKEEEERKEQEKGGGRKEQG